MIIRKIQIDNYLCYYDTNTFELSEGLNIILGENGEGKKYKIKYHELPITWVHVNQGKVNIFFDSLIMLFQLIFLKLKY